ncbi:MAG TPA: aspartate 1-decarboxylase [bacterium]
MCKSKLHGATVTDANVQYAGSVTIDAELMRAADLAPYEQVHLLDLDNGARVVTYCIEGPRGSGTVCVNGAAARLIRSGDRVIVIAYGQYSSDELARFIPTIVVLDERNRIRDVVPSGRAGTGADGEAASLPSGA